MNRRLALTAAGSTALVVVTAGAAIAANLGILTASPKSDVGQLDATRVAELAVSTPASIASVASTQSAPSAPSGDAPVVAVAAERVAPVAPVAPAPTRSTFVAPSSTSTVEQPAAVEPPAPTPSTTYVDDDHEEEDEDEEFEGSLDDVVQDDAFSIESPHPLEEVRVKERIR